ncbi:MAG: DUF748 domain-containing protein [Myxococcota bacterium]
MRRLAPWIALAFVALLLVVRFALPTVLARVASSQLSQALSAEVTVGNVDLWVLGGALAIEGLDVRPSAADPSWLRSRRALVDIGWWELVRGDLDVERLELAGLELALILDADGRITWPGAPEPDDAPPDAEEDEAAPAGEPTELVVRSIDLSEIDVSLRDQSGARDLGVELDAARLGPIRLVLGDAVSWSIEVLEIDSSTAQLRNDDQSAVEIGVALSAGQLGTQPGDPGGFDLTLRLGDGTLNAKGTLAVDPLAVETDLEWQALPLAPLLALAPPGNRPEIASGTSSGALGLRFASSPAPDDAPADEGSEGPAPSVLTGTGQVSVSALDLGVPGEMPMRVSWKELEVALASLEVDASGGGPPNIHISRLALDSPDVRATGAAATDEAGAAAGAPAEAPESAEPPRLRLDSLAVAGGKLRYRDRQFDPPHETVVSDVAVRGRTLRWPEASAASLEIVAGSLGEKPLTLTFSGRQDAGKGTLRGESVSLLIVDPYVRQNSDYAIDRGAVSVDTTFEIEGKRYRAPTRLVLHDLEIDGSDAGSRFQENFGVSLDMALVLLRNTAGDIVLDLPIESGEDGTGVGLTRVVADTLRRVLVNALASPIKLAGGLLGGGDAGDSYAGRAIFFAPGDSDAEESDDPDREDRTESLATLLRERPDLGIRIAAVIVPDDLERVAERAGVEPGDDAAPSPPARALLESLASERLATTRRRIAESLGDRVSNLDARLVVVPWKGEMGKGRPRVVGRLVLHAD